jgi:hypothetical protein
VYVTFIDVAMERRLLAAADQVSVSAAASTSATATTIAATTRLLIVSQRMQANAYWQLGAKAKS